MDQKKQFLDIEVGLPHVQALNNPETIAAFFAKLYYNTNARTPLTTGNLGITKINEYQFGSLPVPTGYQTDIR